MNLAEACKRNVASLQARFDSYLGSCDSAARQQLLDFARVVEVEGKIAINLRPTVLRRFLSSGSFFNIYEWADHICLQSGKDRTAILQDRLGPYYDKRAFDSHFEGGETFRYGALNIAGLGPTRYGEYCMVLNHDSICARCEVAFLMGDSLERYVNSLLQIEAGRLSEECSPDSHKHCLAALKHASELGPDRTEWNRLMCSDDDYVEAIFTGQLATTEVGAIRMSKNDYDLYWEYAYNDFDQKLKELDRCVVDTFADIIESIGNFNLVLELV